MSAAGSLRRSITVERRGTANDGYGNTLTDTWSPVISAEPAEIRPARGGEAVEAGKIEARGLFDVRVRQSSRTLQIRASDRIKDARGSEIWNVRYIENRDMRGKFLTLVCESGVAHG
jgi:head-tail adaptor